MIAGVGEAESSYGQHLGCRINVRHHGEVELRAR